MNFLGKIFAIAALLTSLVWQQSTFAVTHPLTSCNQLKAPNAVLLVHAAWCPHCRTYLPVYTAVSNLPEMKSYKFYVRRDDRAYPVCGVPIRSVPITFTNNMKQRFAGELTESGLINFVTGS